MTEARAEVSSRRPLRHERPVIDEAGLAAARHADRLLAAAREAGLERWIAYLEPLPDHLRDDEPVALRATATRCRAAFGVKDSIRDSLPSDLTEPFLDSIDRLIRELNRDRARA
ncbi:MAG TPA: hypothetical protein VF119_09715 [Candidatus Limnocylindrales bacterium]